MLGGVNSGAIVHLASVLIGVAGGVLIEDAALALVHVRSESIDVSSGRVQRHYSKLTDIIILLNKLKL